MFPIVFRSWRESHRQKMADIWRVVFSPQQGNMIVEGPFYMAAWWWISWPITQLEKAVGKGDIQATRFWARRAHLRNAPNPNFFLRLAYEDNDAPHIHPQADCVLEALRHTSADIRNSLFAHFAARDERYYVRALAREAYSEEAIEYFFRRQLNDVLFRALPQYPPSFIVAAAVVYERLDVVEKWWDWAQLKEVENIILQRSWSKAAYQPQAALMLLGAIHLQRMSVAQHQILGQHTHLGAVNSVERSAREL